VRDVPLLRSSPSLWEVLHEEGCNLHFDPQLHGSWVIMNIINCIGALHVCLSHQVRPQRTERCGRAATPNVTYAEHTQMCTAGERIQG